VVWVETAGSQLIEKFSTDLEHLLAELARIELKLYLAVKTRRQAESSAGADPLQNLYISEQEVDNLQQEFMFLNERLASRAEDPALKTFTELDQELQVKLESRKQELLNRGQELRLDRLSRLFHLSRTELDIVLICLLPEIDPKYQRLYGYLQDNITKKLPSAGLVLQLLSDSLEGMSLVRDTLSAGSPLLKNYLVQMADGDSGQIPFSAKLLRLDERISAFLLGSDRTDARLTGLAHILDKTAELPEMTPPDEIRCRLPGLAARYRKTGLAVYLRDVQPGRRKSAARMIGSVLQIPLLYIDLDQVSSADISPEILIALIFREGLLRKTAVFFSGCDLFLDQDNSPKPAYVNFMQALKNYPYWVFLSGEKEWSPGDLLANKICINLEIDPISYSERQQIWEKYRTGAHLSSDINLPDIAAKFRLDGPQIRDVIATASNLALWRDPETGEISAEDLYASCRKLSAGNLAALAQRIQSPYHWQDIVLPSDQVEQLHEICSYIENYHKVYTNWGFGRKLSGGKGSNILFAGPSGTGKTMAAGIIAHELHLDLYRIDLSAVVSKYIGETEKNLERIFREGQTSNAILFFDEADALFGKRSEVKDAHDRYANIEIAYLLQKMDEYEGAVILATNLRKNMDDSFTRRIQFAVEFPLPDEEDRLRIWNIIFPAEAPVAADVDLRFMSQFKISGGNIKNIAVYSAFLAARAAGTINMEHLIRATRREYQKTGRLCTEEDFAQYYKLVKM
jgi:ATP-dependent 26S proteasome regulatory subunit